MFDTVRKTICKTYKELQELPTEVLVQERMDKFFAMGVYHE
jgi:acetyl-CoA carboxylase alpha subunit